MLKLVRPIPAKHRNVPAHLIKTEHPQTLGAHALAVLRALLATRVVALATALLLPFVRLLALARRARRAFDMALLSPASRCAA